MLYEDLLRKFTEMSCTVFGENLVGIYLHGSLAMGCLNPKKSDLDLILVVENSLTFEEKKSFTEGLLHLSVEAPEKGFELSIVKKEVCKPFRYPTPFEYHYSDGHKEAVLSDLSAYIEKMHGEDKDLGAHFTIINHYGVALYGPPVSEIFAPVPKKNYIDSIWFDVQNAESDILEAPLYITLNLCRVLGFLKDDLVLSKKTGGEWGMENVPEKYRSLIQAAYAAYISNTEMAVDVKNALEFAVYMTKEIKTAILSDPENVTPAMLTDM